MQLKPGDIIIKDTDVLRGMMERRFDPLLINIILDIAKTHGVCITESYREKRHMNDLHGTQPVRAIDARFWAYGSDRAGYEIQHWINSKWSYDPGREKMQVAVVHDTGSGVHFHIQVHGKTRLRSHSTWKS